MSVGEMRPDRASATDFPSHSGNCRRHLSFRANYPALGLEISCLLSTCIPLNDSQCFHPDTIYVDRHYLPLRNRGESPTRRKFEPASAPHLPTRCRSFIPAIGQTSRKRYNVAEAQAM
ncbi:uncharacterized protein APUU_20493S [Aspergillus puulaauensis]|uniref:Uncharacterized protein n=1 Tax=Aspergillus puulaauensis TaxID=1220207 RepID=A0A7R7XF45_9EURO|nr:uncharacterized protein APUU_20493S [Aspergillus puulaauensis]BCS20061.1 hypothetical protein APUU_20493S [Aspergillus puulaauensis]